jgi:hypothetical protein
MQSPTRHASWQELLRSPAAPSHIVQIYENDDFLTSAVALYAAEGLRRGEAVFLTGTDAHLRGVHRVLISTGVDPNAAIRTGQLSVSDAHAALAAVLVEDRPDPARFEGLAGDALARARADTRFSGVRWWGEISNALHEQGNKPGALLAEDLADTLTKKHGITLFCSFLCDKFHPSGYDGIFREMCAKHSHVIPADDYVRHRLAVNRAIGEVVGEIKGPLLQSLLSWKGLSCDLPSSQTMLFWLHEDMPEHFHDVLSRAKEYQRGQIGV